MVSTLAVKVSIDDTGAPFGLRATQRLDVRRIGDYFFTIGAPVAEPAYGRRLDGRPRSADRCVPLARLQSGTPDPRRVGRPRPGSGRRVAASDRGRRRDASACATRPPSRVAAFTADGNPAQLRTYLAALRAAAARGEPATGGGTSVTSMPAQVRMTISAPLAIEGTIGTRRVRLTLGGSGRPESATFPAGPIQLTVRPLPPLELLSPPPGESGTSALRPSDPRLARVGAVTPVRHLPRQPRPGRPEQRDVRLRHAPSGSSRSQPRSRRRRPGGTGLASCVIGGRSARRGRCSGAGLG